MSEGKIIEHTIDLQKLLSPEQLADYQEACEEAEKVFCKCGYLDKNPRAGAEYKPEGIRHLGVKKHGWLCPKCKKFVQIG